MANTSQIVAASLDESISVKRLVREQLAAGIVSAGDLLVDSLRSGGKVILFGNGGSAADAQHLAAELIGRFETERRSLPALALTTDSSALTAIGNDYGYEFVFSRQVEGLARAGDVAIALSTSGASVNVAAAAKRCAELGVSTIALTGQDGGIVAEACALALCVPSARTARIQEAHITIGHVLCEIIDSELTAARGD